MGAPSSSDASRSFSVLTLLLSACPDSLDIHFMARTAGLEKKITELRTDFAGVTNELSVLRDSAGGGDPSVMHDHADAIARLEQHSAQLLAHKVGVDQELAEVTGKLQALTNKVTDQVSNLEHDVARVVKSRPALDDRLDKMDDKVAGALRQISTLADMKAVEHFMSIRMAREIHELETRMTQNLQFATEKLESKVLQTLETRLAHSQRNDALATSIKNDIMDEMQSRFLSVSNGGLRKADLVPVQSAQAQLQEEMAQLSSALARQERKTQDSTQATTSELRDELANVRQELARAIQAQQGRMASALEDHTSSKVEQQIALLARKQKKMEEITVRMHETMTAMRQELRSKGRQTEDLKQQHSQREKQAALRERLVSKSLAELESLFATKVDVERQYQQQVSRHEARLAELRASLTAKETQMEAQRRELIETLQQEAKRMGLAEGKNAVLTTLLAQEKVDHEEKSELLRRARKEMNIVRQKLRDTESEATKRRQQLAAELQAKQQHVRDLTKRLQLSERDSSKLLENAMREAKAIRRLKATKEHELLLAKMKLGEMERAALEAEADEETMKQVAEYVAAASANAEQADMRREEMEQMLLASHLEIDGLRQELEFVSKELDVVKEQQEGDASVDDAIAKVSREYEEKVAALQQQILDKETALSELRDAMAERGDLGALETELSALKEDKKSLLEAMQRTQQEHHDSESSGNLIHEKEFATMHQQMEARVNELDEAQAALEASKESISALEKELEHQKSVHNDTVEKLTQEIRDARATIDSCSTEMLTLKETKTRLEAELAQLEAKLTEVEGNEDAADESAQADADETQRVREELQSTLDSLAEKEELLQQAKKCDEDNRQQLIAMAESQHDMERRYMGELEALTQTLKQERESSQCREQDMSSTVAMLSSEVALLKSESQQVVESCRAELMTQMTSLSDSLKASQTQEQRLQHRLQRILNELSTVANVSSNTGAEVENDAAGDGEAETAVVKQYLETLQEQQRRTARELDELQAEYERVVAKAASDSATAQSLTSQVDGYTSQIQDLEQEVARLEEQLKDEYAKSATVAKCSGDIEEEVVVLRKQKRELEEQVDAKSAEYDECVAAFQSQVDAKQSQVEELLEQNAALNATMETVRQKMDAVEAEKARELDDLRDELLELETRAEDLHRFALQPTSAHERDFYANHQEVVALAQDVRSTFEKLTSSCGVLEWSDIRASVYAKEEVTERLFLEKSRELSRIQNVEQQILLNTDFLNAWTDECVESADDADAIDAHRPLWLSKYAALAPEVVSKLQAVQGTLQDAVAGMHSAQQKELEASASASDALFDSAMADRLDALAEEYASHKTEGAAAVEHSGDDKVSNVSTDETDDDDAKLPAAVPHAPGSQQSDTRGELLSNSLSGMVEDYFDSSAAASNKEEGDDRIDSAESSHDMDEVERLLLAQSGDDVAAEQESPLTKVAALKFGKATLEEDEEMDEVERLMSAQASSLKKLDDDEFGDEFGDHATGGAGGNDEEYLEESFDLEESLRDDDVETSGGN